MERVIPLRFVMMANDCNNPQPYYGCGHVPPNQTVCSTCTDGATNCGPDTISIGQIKDSVEKANFALRTLGVQVWVERIEKYLMPTFWRTDDDQQPNWSQVWAQLRGPYPNVTSSWPFAGTDILKEPKWLHATTIRVGNPREIIVFVAECSAGGDGRRVYQGASSFVGDREIIESARAFTHEVGHVLGLDHTMYWTEPWKTPNTEDIPDEPGGGGTPVWTDPAAYWELTYGKDPVTQQVWYPNSFAEAWNWEHGNPPKPLYSKMTWDPAPGGVNCVLDTTTCIPSCCVGSAHPPGGAANKPVNGQCASGQFETIGTPTAGIKGLGFTFNGGLYGPNAMGYWNYGGSIDTCDWSSFSESQAAQVRRTLRSDTRINSAEVAAPYSAGYRAQRFRLGEWRNRTGFDRLDFDGDGKHDIAVWQPPGTPGAGPTVGKFRARLSSTSYATTQEADFGQPGDVPVPADYDGDGKTDFAVIRRGGLNGQTWSDSEMWWIWCPSASGGACPAPNTCTEPSNCTHWGYQYDVPLPGLSFGGDATKAEVAVYRPSTKYVHWRRIDWTASGNIYTRFEDNVVLLPGLYDADSKTDVVSYNPGNARFFMVLSTSGWDHYQGVARYFDVALRPDALAASDAGGAAPALRHGGVPLPVESAGRRRLRVWDAYTGVWYTMWNPINSAAYETCQWGAARDVPLAPIDVNGDGTTDYAVFRPDNIPPTVYLKTRNATCQAGVDEYPFPVNGASPRWVISAVPDLKGSDDGLRDILVLDPDQSTWTRYHSQVSAPFTQQPALGLGSVGAMGL